MLVRCKHYSTTYPNGGHTIGDIFDLAKEQAIFYSDIGWVNILPDELQPKIKRGRRKSNNNAVIDLSKSMHIGRYPQHIFNK